MSEVQFDPIEAARALERRESEALENMRFAAEREAMAATLLSPNWAKWAARGAIELWQLVALSLNLEPVIFRRLVYFEARLDRPGHSRAQVVEIELLGRLRDSLPYSQRLAEACSWIGLDAGLAPRSCGVTGGPERTWLPRGTFVTWAQTKGWLLPDSMTQWAEVGKAIIPSTTYSDLAQKPLSATSPATPASVRGQGDAERRMVIMQAFRECFGDVNRLPFYPIGSHKGDPALGVAMAALPSASRAKVRELVQALHRSAEVGPKDRQLKRGDPRLPVDPAG